MVHFVIAGRSDCVNFLHAVLLADYLKDHLPNFEVHVIEKSLEDWKLWLIDQNQKNGWHHTISPIIWREFIRGGKPYLLGHLSEFWEYIYDYYGLESKLTRDELANLVSDHLQHLEEKEQEKANAPKNVRNICISGVANSVIIKLLPELVDVLELDLPDGVCIKLYDRYMDEPGREEFVDEVLEDFSSYPYRGVKKKLEVVTTLGEGLEDCDIFLILDYFKKDKYLDFEDLIQHKMSVMMHYADSINSTAPRDMKVILAHDGPSCFNATILVAMCTMIRIANIVVITSDLGLGPLTVLSEKTEIPVARMGAPPVWGFIGINKIIDINNVIHVREMYMPYSRAARCDEESTLPLGIIKRELKSMSYLINDTHEIIYGAKKFKKKEYDNLDRIPFHPKVRAIISLLKIWFSNDERDDIISLGVCSNGSFDLPNGVVFSQPVMLNSKKIWVPFKDFPVSKTTKEKIQACVPPALKLLNAYNIEIPDSGSYCSTDL